MCNFLLFDLTPFDFKGDFRVADFDSKNEAEDGMILMRGDPLILGFALQITYRETKTWFFVSEDDSGKY